MGKITPRFFLAVFICGLFLLSANTALSNINYGPESPVAKKQTKKHSFFVGFYLDAAPSITAPDDKTVNTDSGKCFASNVNLGTPQTSGDSTSTDISVNGSNINPSINEFPIGTTTVTWTITNDEGTNSDTQVITVLDNENPTITAPADISISTDNNKCTASDVNLGTPTTGDNCGIKNTTNDAPAVFPIGETTVIYTVIDNSDNTATAIQTVKVGDNEKPVISHNGDQEITTDAGQCGASFNASATASDNCNVGTPMGTRSDGRNLNALYPVGTTTIIWTVTEPFE